MMESVSYNCIQLYILAALSIASSVLIRLGVNWAWLQGSFILLAEDFFDFL